MYRIDTPNRLVDKFGTGKDGYTEGVAGVSPPTALTDDMFDAFQEEICAVIEAASITLSKSNNHQLLAALGNLFATVAKGVTNGDSHDHSGGDGGTIAHGSLSDKGNNTHAQIDTFIGSKGQNSGLAALTSGGGITVTGSVEGASVIATDGGVHGTATIGNNSGVVGQGHGSGTGINGTAGVTGTGAIGTGGSTSGDGGAFEAATDGAGVRGYGRGTQKPGVVGSAVSGVGGEFSACATQGAIRLIPSAQPTNPTPGEHYFSNSTYKEYVFDGDYWQVLW